MGVDGLFAASATSLCATALERPDVFEVVSVSLRHIYCTCKTGP